MPIKHKIRMKGDGKLLKEVLLTPGRAVRRFCVECNGWLSHKVKKCTDNHCPLHPYRMGCNPSRKGVKKTTGKVTKNRPFVS